MSITIAIIIFVVVVLGFLGFRYFRSLREEQVDRSLPPVIAPLQMLTVLLIAFVLSSSATFFGTAVQNAKSEAQAMDNFYFAAQGAPKAQAQSLQADAVCYERSTVNYEWPALEAAENGSSANQSNVPTVWVLDMTQNIADDAKSPTYNALTNAQQQRATARIAEEGEAAAAAVPPQVIWLMALVILVTIALYAWSLPKGARRSHLFGVAAAALLFAGSLWLIQDIGKPFGGMVSVSSGSMASQGAFDTQLFDHTYGEKQLPCTSTGAPKPGIKINTWGNTLGKTS